MLSTLQALAARRHIYRRSFIGHRSSASVLLFDCLTTVCLHAALLLPIAAAATPHPNIGMQAVVASGATAATAAAADDDSSCMYHLLFAQSNSSQYYKPYNIYDYNRRKWQDHRHHIYRRKAIWRQERHK